MQDSYRLQPHEAWQDIPSAIGPLQGLLSTPAAATSETPWAIICHPHPQHQGTMFNKVVTTAAKACAACHIPSVRFNYRGIGDSAGHYTTLGDACADVDAVYDWLHTQQQPRTLWWLGFSFGGYVATYGASRYPSTGLITMAPSMARMPFAQLPYPPCPWWIIQGEDDEVVSPQAVYTWSAQHTNTLIRMPACSHFFHGQLVQLKAHLVAILSANEHV